MKTSAKKPIELNHTVKVEFSDYDLKFVITKHTDDYYTISCNKEKDETEATSLREAFNAIGMYVYNMEQNAGLLN